MTDRTAARLRMVETQLVARGIRDPRVLDAMRTVPRHRFVPPGVANAACEDRPLPIGECQTISQPYMVAVMTQLLGPESHHRVLEIGTGSGYQTAILARLAAHVMSIERHPALTSAARGVLADLEVGNVTLTVGDGTEGWPEGAPYDRILVTAGAPSVPDTLLHQLAEAGRLVIPVGGAQLQQLTVVVRRGTAFETRSGEGCVFVPLIGRHGWADTR